MIDNNFTYWMKHSIVYCQTVKHRVINWLKRSVVYCLIMNHDVADWLKGSVVYCLAMKNCVTVIWLENCVVYVNIILITMSLIGYKLLH